MDWMLVAKVGIQRITEFKVGWNIAKLTEDTSTVSRFFKSYTTRNQMQATVWAGREWWANCLMCGESRAADHNMYRERASASCVTRAVRGEKMEL